MCVSSQHTYAHRWQNQQQKQKHSENRFLDNDTNNFLPLCWKNKGTHINLKCTW